MTQQTQSQTADAPQFYLEEDHHPEGSTMLGFWLYLMSDCLIFAVLFATHGVIGNGGAIDQFLKDCKAGGFKVNGIFDALGGDMVAVIAAAAKKAGGVDPVKLREAIRAPGGYPGITAETISFAEKKSYPVKTVPVIGFSEGKRTLITDAMPPNIPYLK